MNKPLTFRMFDAGVPSLNGASRAPVAPKWFTGGECFMLADNSLLEVSTDSRGCFIYAHWKAVKDFYTFKPHQSEAIKLEQF